jgi:hypothetical protein
MATIELYTKKSNRPAVFARDKTDTKPIRKGGDVEAHPGDALGWECANEQESFLVRFFRFDTGDNTWPFSQAPDKTGTGPNPVRYLRVNSKSTKWMTVTSPETVKYEVEDESGSADPLDPMIIIRKPAGISANLVLPVTCAVLGAIVGALATALLM